MATIVDGKMRSGELKDNDQVVVDVEAAGEGIFAKKSDVETDIQRIDTALAGKQDTLTFDNTPTEGSSNPVTSDGIKQAIDAATPSDYNEVKSQVQQNTQDIAGIEGKIPAQASAQNQLADKAFVNSSIQTNTATFRGTYNLVTDLGLTVSATEEQTATAIATHLASLVPPVVPENNDYVFVQIPRETSDPTVVVRYDRYKCSVTEAGGVVTRTWSFEFSLNNSSFTADQWAAINSGITSGDVAKIQLIDALVGRGYIGFQNGGNKVLAISGEQLTVYKTVSRRATTTSTSYSNKIGFKFNLKEFVAYCLSAINDPIGKSTIDQVQLNGSAKLKLYFPNTTTAYFARIGVYTSPTATTPVSVSESQLIDSLGTITECTFEFSSQQYITADATYYFRIEDDSGTAIPCYIYASNKFTGFSWAYINSDGTAGSDISSTMPDLQLGCNIKTYYTIELEAKDLVALENFSQQKTYAQGERVVYNNDLYEVKAGGHAAGAWNENHFKKLFSIGSNLTMGDAKVEKRATSSVWPSPSGNIVAGQNGATASGANNIAFGYGVEVRNRNESSLTDTTMDNIALGNAARIINDLLASARKPTTDATAVADAVYFGYGAKYSSAATYAYQSYCSYGYGVYQCTSAISSPEVWNAAHWSLKDALDYDATKTYAVGDVCKHSGSLYTCSTAIDTPKDWDVDDWTYVSLGEFQEGAMVSLTTSAGSTLPQDDYLQIYIAPAGYMTGISRAILFGAFSVIRASGGIGIGNNLTVNDPDATVIGNGATSHGAKSLNFAATELIKVFLGDANLVDLINQAVADQMIKAAVSAEVMQTRSTPTATRKLLALNPANPTGEKTEVTAQDIGAATAEQGAKADTAIQTVKVNGAALTPDANKAVDVPVPVKATTAPVIAGTAAIGNSAKFAAENHVHPAETEIVEYRLPDECFPITYTYQGTDYSISDNGGIEIIGGNAYILIIAKDAGYSLCTFGAASLKYIAMEATITAIAFNNTTPTENTWPVLEKDAVFVRDVQVAKDADVLKNSGNQTLDGDLQVGNNAQENIHLLKDTATVVAERIKNNYSQYSHTIPSGTKNDTLALLTDIYAAVQQIAPAWVSGTTYEADAKVSYNGVVYARKTSGSITSSTNPASDTTNWEATKVSELFLPLTGGTMTGALKVYMGMPDGYNYIEVGYNQLFCSRLTESGLTRKIGGDIYTYVLPLSSGTLALLQNLAANYSTFATYAINQLCVYSDKLYRCTTAITTAEAWTAAHWTEATVEDVLAAIRSALDTKAPLASPAFTGTPTAPNLTDQSADGQVANKKYVDDKVAGATPNLDYVMRIDPETGGIYYTTPDTNA